MSKISVECLTTQTVATTFNTSYNNSFPTNNTVGPFELKVPQSSVLMAKPLSYDFRVAEYVNDKDEIIKVGLQVAVFEHDNYGGRQLRQDFVDVERVKIKL
jgi:hypothetical protein